MYMYNVQCTVLDRLARVGTLQMYCTVLYAMVWHVWQVSMACIASKVDKVDF